MKVVINKCYGGFGLSDKAYERLIALGVPARKHTDEWTEPERVIYINDADVMGLLGPYTDDWFRMHRDDKLLVKVVKELGAKANGRVAALKIVDVPAGTNYTIEDYDGQEWVAEVHKTWG